MNKDPSIWKQIFTTQMLSCIGTGFASGLPLYLLIQMLPTWMRDYQVDLKTIGLFSLTSLPYVWKFVWAPLLDISPSFMTLPRRKGWAIITQMVLILCMIALLFMNPIEDITSIAAVALVIAFASASQDAVLDAHRREILTDEEMGLGSSIFVNAYRLSSLVPGSLALLLADLYSWNIAHTSVIVTLVCIIGFTLWMPEPAQPKRSFEGLSAFDVFGEPFKEFRDRNGLRNMSLILAFMLFYKLGDSMATSLSSAFYLDLGFTKTELASTVKVASLWASIAGGIIGGVWMLKLGVQRALWVFGWFQLLTILGFAYLAWDSSILPLHQQFPDLTGEGIALQERLHPNHLALFWVVSAEYLGIGLGTAAFVAFIASHTNKRFSAAQFALLTSISGLPRTLASSTSGWVVESIGYTGFFLTCTCLALPGMVLLFWVPAAKSLDFTPTSTKATSG
jgi:MFS transporter, PAT family, beta-lactamase induction signal transducer AmpG